MSKLIVLDRDGVINEDSAAYVKSPEEFIPIPGSLAAIAKLNVAGYTVVVATNQSGIARGYFSEQTLIAMHHKLEMLVVQQGGKINGIYYCPHGPDDQCECRKPKSGLLMKIISDYSVCAQDVYVIGDSMRDLQMATSLNAKPILVKTGNGNKTLQALGATQQLKNVPVYDDLAHAANALILL
ncbi:MAG: D-glycero-beta-D-manno-heptose 1,7-bisphosphate 7-phosphatase [Gammaproteobacteria bacterium]|nr:D-glycero-beta-D-manno-heptose 1,7-bisphosphate 7-phosphatase [Gammaproteobacteria bacterium]